MEHNLIDEMINKARLAQQEFEGFSQEQVDAVVKAIGKAIYDNAQLLAEQAVEETGFGQVDSKVWKQRKSVMAAWMYLRDKPSVGIIEEDFINGLVCYAKPLGIVACMTPSTNPTSTLGSNGMSIIKSRNAMIVTPHPRSKKTCANGVRLVNERLKALGAPENLIQIIEEPTLALSQELMSKCDVTVATGGASMIKAAYSCGRPTFGVGQGNVQALAAPDYEDVSAVAITVTNNRCYDNGMPCTCEQAVFFPKQREKEYLAAFADAGAYLIEDGERAEALGKLLFKENGAIDPAYVGLTAVKLAEHIGLKIPDSSKILMVKAEGSAGGWPLNKEKLCPVLLYYSYDSFDEALARAKENLLLEGAGHSATIFTNCRETAKKVGETLPVSRVVVNQAGSTASGGNLINGLAPTMSLGCGSWGRNSISENLTYKHLMNITRVAFPKKHFVFPSPEEVWGE